MQFVPGHSLEEELMRGRLDWRVALQIARQITGALAHLARHGITHRDVSLQGSALNSGLAYATY